MTTHVEAEKLVAEAIPGVKTADSLLVRIIGCLESSYGKGWAGPGKGSHNWGAMTAGRRWKGATFEYKDSRYDPKAGKNRTYTTRFRKYPTEADGIRDLYRTLTSGAHSEASRLARVGKWSEVSRAIGPRGSKYYMGVGPPEEAERKHQQRFMSLKDEILDATGGVSRDLRGRITYQGPTIFGWPEAIVIGAVVATAIMFWPAKKRGR
jgi:hypothetical protein